MRNKISLQTISVEGTQRSAAVIKERDGESQLVPNVFSQSFLNACAPGMNPSPQCSPGANLCAPGMNPCMGTQRSTRSTCHVQKDPERLLNGLDSIWLEITPKCNLQCVHCYAESGPNEPLVHGMQFEDWLRVLFEAFELGCRRVQFIGGEPTIHPYFSNLVVEVRKIGFQFIEVFSNGMNINNNLLGILRDCRANLVVSVYSSNDNTHDAITGQANSLQKTLRTLKRAINFGLEVRANIIVMPENLVEIESTKELLSKLGVKSISVDRVRGVGRGKKQSPNTNHCDELCGSCWEGRLCVDFNGQASPCVFARSYQVGNVKESLKTLLGGTLLATFRREMYSRMKVRGVPPGKESFGGPLW